MSRAAPARVTPFKRWLRGTAPYQHYKAWQVARREGRWQPVDQRRYEFYRQFLPEGGVCFDVGANIGNRAKIFRRLGARVVAVEPQQACVLILRRLFREDAGVVVRPQVLGPAPGRTEIKLCDLHMLTSLSQRWIDAVQQSGRFAGWRWDRVQAVDMTTLDALIAEFGVPDFIKIDVEGYEEEVLKGLTRPVRALSFEFTPEYLPAVTGCLNHLRTLGTLECNYSLGESMVLELSSWQTPQELLAQLERYENDRRVFGDVYVRFPAATDQADIRPMASLDGYRAP
ncbi:MAG: FkbM family methyltransferase [Magnetococcus sp. WYHC-3]